jgi:hypothetical protein
MYSGWPTGVGVLAWLYINFAITRDPFAFLTSEYSTRAINAEGLGSMAEQYRTGGNLGLTLLVYTFTVADSIGWAPLILGLIGMCLFVFSRRSMLTKVAVGIPMLFPAAFTITTLFEGTTTIIQHPLFTDGQWWNLRYGLLTMPALAFFVGYLASVRRRLAIPIVAIVIVSWFVTVHFQGVATLEEALYNQNASDAQNQIAAAHWLATNYDDSGPILMERSGNERATFASGLSLRSVVYEGDQSDWTGALIEPAEHVTWVFMRSRFKTSDRVWSTLRGTPELTDHFSMVYQAHGVEIYRLRDGNTLPIVAGTEPIEEVTPEEVVAQDEPVIEAPVTSVPVSGTVVEAVAPIIVAAVTVDPAPAETTNVAPVAVQPGTDAEAVAPTTVDTNSPEAVEAVAPVEAVRIYTVRLGDTLWLIAAEVYRDPRRWSEIFEANRDQIKVPELIRVGQKLRIP